MPRNTLKTVLKELFYACIPALAGAVFAGMITPLMALLFGPDFPVKIVDEPSSFGLQMKMSAFFISVVIPLFFGGIVSTFLMTTAILWKKKASRMETLGQAGFFFIVSFVWGLFIFALLGSMACLLFTENESISLFTIMWISALLGLVTGILVHIYNFCPKKGEEKSLTAEQQRVLEYLQETLAGVHFGYGNNVVRATKIRPGDVNAVCILLAGQFDKPEQYPLDSGNCTVEGLLQDYG